MMNPVNSRRSDVQCLTVTGEKGALRCVHVLQTGYKWVKSAVSHFKILNSC